MRSRKFATVINCIDGRVQYPVLQWIKERLTVDYVDTITEPGVDKVFSEGCPGLLEHIKEKVLISTSGHYSRVISLVGHYDCAANPGPREQHVKQIFAGIETIKSWDLGVRVLGLWVGETWEVECLCDL